MILEGLLARAVQMSTPLLLGSLGEVMVERTGVMNMASKVFFLGAWRVSPGLHHGSLAPASVRLAAGVAVGALYGWIRLPERTRS